MSIRGYFATGSPYIAARLLIPRFYLVYEVKFLMDTGTDSTVVMPRDANTMGIDYSQLRGNIPSTGVGGVVHSFSEPALLVFTDTGRVEYTYRLDVRFMKDTVISRQLPSLLGRDVINRWSIVYDPAVDMLEATVRSADLMRPLHGPQG